MKNASRERNAKQNPREDEDHQGRCHDCCSLQRTPKQRLAAGMLSDALGKRIREGLVGQIIKVLKLADSKTKYFSPA